MMQGEAFKYADGSTFLGCAGTNAERLFVKFHNFVRHYSPIEVNRHLRGAYCFLH
jgi:hypothetical protein